MVTPRIIIYGPLTGYSSSFPYTMRSIARGLTDNGIEVAACDTTGMAGGFANGELDDLVESGKVVRYDFSADLSAPIRESGAHTFLTLNPHPMLSRGAKELGLDAVGLFVGDVDEVPFGWVESLKHVDLAVTQSHWMAQVVRKHRDDVLVGLAGVGASFRRASEGPAKVDPFRPVRVLFTCSAIYYPERKAMAQATGALSMLMKAATSPLRVEPRVIVPRRTKAIDLANALDESHLVVCPIGMTQQEMRAQYLWADILLCPSRAEGLGLQPLEVRACGRPVVQTLATGMATHTDGPPLDGVVVVPHGDLAPAWGDFGQAPSVKTQDVYQALCLAIDRLGALHCEAWDNAPAVAEAWSWKNATAGLADWLRQRRVVG